MKHFRIAVILAAASLAAACSQASLDKYQAGAGRVIAGLQTTQQVIVAVDDTVAKINASLYAQCKNLTTVGNAAVKVSPTCTTAGKVVGGVNAAITSYCQAGPTTGLASTTSAAASAYIDVHDQLAATKAACAKGG